YTWARMPELRVCGKTGSAQCVPRVMKWRYTFEITPGDQRTVSAPTEPRAREILRQEMLDELRKQGASLEAGAVDSSDPAVQKVIEQINKARRVDREREATWPPRDHETNDYPTHAWFAGFAPHR